MKLNIQLFGGRGASYGIFTSPDKANIMYDGEWMSEEFFREVQNQGRLYVKDWFSPSKPRYAMTGKMFEKEDILKETPKAVLVAFSTEDLSGEHDVQYSSWVPKAAVYTEKMRNDLYGKRERKRDRAMKKGMKEWEKVYEFAKKNNIKGIRKNSKKITMLKKIEEAGLKYK